MKRDKFGYKPHRVKTERREVKNPFAGAALWMAALVTAGALAAGYLEIIRSNEALGKQNSEAKARKAALDRRVTNEEFTWARQTTPDNIRRLIQQFHLNLEMPKESSIVHTSRGSNFTALAKGDDGSSHD